MLFLFSFNSFKINVLRVSSENKKCNRTKPHVSQFHITNLC